MVKVMYAPLLSKKCCDKCKSNPSEVARRRRTIVVNEGAGQPKKKKPPTPKPTPKYSWTMHPDGDGKVNVNCYKDPKGLQTILSLQSPEEMLEDGIDFDDFGLRETTEATAFHDETLQQATGEINNILRRVQRNNEVPGRLLSMIAIDSRQLLVWATYDVIGPDEDLDIIEETATLKTRENRLEPSFRER
jgi:hypothetical protein